MAGQLEIGPSMATCYRLDFALDMSTNASGSSLCWRSGEVQHYQSDHHDHDQ
jgi:hypothetical protein